jgi:hypothetical protein
MLAAMPHEHIHRLVFRCAPRAESYRNNARATIAVRLFQYAALTEVGRHVTESLSKNTTVNHSPNRRVSPYRNDLRADLGEPELSCQVIGTTPRARSHLAVQARLCVLSL